MSKLISIIMPVYNAERFIGRALDSLLSQSYANFEVIIIDDGSTDNSAQICNTYKNKDNRIKIFYQNNSGVGAARNYGISIARGETLLFIDADDYILNHALERLQFGYEQSGKPMIVGGVFRQDSQGKICRQNSPTGKDVLPLSEKQTMLDKAEIINCVWRYLETNDVYLVSHCWGRLFDRKFIENNDLRFNEDMKISEDCSFNLKCLYFLDNVLIINEPLYCFQTHNNHQSLSLLAINSDSLVHDYGTLRNELIHFLSRNNNFEDFQLKQTVGSMVINLIIGQLVRVGWSINAKSYPSACREIKLLISSDLVQQSLKYYHPKHGHSKIIPFLIKIRMVRLLIYFSRRRAIKRYGKWKSHNNANTERFSMNTNNYKTVSRKELLLEKLKNSKQPVIICGAGFVGKVIFDICKKAGINVAGFSDNDTDLVGTDVCGVPVYYTPEISKKFLNANFIISVMTIKDVVKVLHNQDIENWYAGEILLEEFDTVQADASYHIDDGKYAVESCKISHQAFGKKDYVFIRSIDIMITERCSLKCDGCANLMQYFERPQDYSLQETLEWTNNFLEYVDEVMEARIIGGDAFMNRDWPKMVEHMTSIDKIKRVKVYANAKIIPDMKYIPALAHAKVLVMFTDYGKLSMNLDKIVDLFERNKVRYKIVRTEQWDNCATIHKHNRTDEQNDQIFSECCAACLSTITKGKVFRCPFAASTFLLEAGEFRPTDFLDVNALVANKVEINAGKKMLNDYINSTKALGICDYCTGRLPKARNKLAPAVQVSKPLKYERVTKYEVSKGQ